MDAERLGRIQSIFDAAVEQPPAERLAFVERTCAGDAELLDRVMRLIAAGESTGGAAFIDVAVRRATMEFTEPASRSGLTLGPWRLLRELGHGGMGSVWLAERTDGAYHARVAIKLVRGGFASDELERRFRAERQILADLHHPNIAALVGGGDAPDGTPYIVMECIEGEPITAWAGRRALGLAERLRLFRAVCDAVQHAHRSLVVHRDIKPSNILVGEDGVPKLMDFGIAKPLAPDSGGDTTALVRRMTPAYASPEQLRGERINVATDVWSLGVLLYELVTGVQPFTADGMTTEEVRRRILEHEPPAPSEALRRRAGAHSAVGPRELAGDLDNIVWMALRKEPALRYGSVDQLSEDVRRHLHGVPITARPATVGYRLRKFVARNAAAVAAVSVISLALAGGLGATLWQAQRAERAQRRAEAALAQSVEVKDFLVSLFRASDPRESRGADVTARELLERGVQRAGELAEQPALQAELLTVLGSVQMELGEYRSAADMFGRGETIRRARAGSEDDSLIVQAINMRGRALNMLGLQDSAVLAFEEASALGRRLLGEEHGIVRAAANNLAISYSRLGRAAEAESIYRRLVPVDRRVLGPDHIDRSYVLNNLGVQLANEGRFVEGEPFLRETLRLRLLADSGDHPGNAMALDNLGMLLREAGRYDEAEPVLRRGLAMRERTLGRDHRMTGASYFSLGTLLALRGRGGDHAEADSVLRRGLAVYRSTLGPDHPAVAYVLHSLGELADRRGEPAESERWFREALVIRRDSTRDSPRVAVLTLAALGSVLSRRGAADADTVLREAVALARARVSAADHARSRATIELALHLARRGDSTAAEPLFVEGLTALAARIGAAHPDVVRACVAGRALRLAASDCGS